MRILITGGTGQLGRSLQRALEAHSLLSLGHAELDITDPRPVTAVFAHHRPDVVIHCAALTDTNRCESEPSLARAVNGTGTQNVAAACQRAEATLIAVSTNEVFHGDKHEPYLESDATGPVNAYGLSKLDGEILAAATCPKTLIVRTSWLYGDGYMNFVEKVRAEAEAGRKLSFVTDEIATPTATDDLAGAIARLVDLSAPAGTYHLANEGAASRYDWAVEILRLAGFSRVAIEAVTMKQLRDGGYAGPEKPPYSVLANTRAAALGVRLRPWQDALAAYFERARVAADA